MKIKEVTQFKKLDHNPKFIELKTEPITEKILATCCYMLTANGKLKCHSEKAKDFFARNDEKNVYSIPDKRKARATDLLTPEQHENLECKPKLYPHQIKGYKTWK